MDNMAVSAASAHPARLMPTPCGLMLAGVLLVKRSPGGALAFEKRKLRALLAAAAGKPVTPRVLLYVRRAGELFAEVSDEDLDYADYPLPRPLKAFSGNQFPVIAKLTMLLALSGFSCPDDPMPRLLKMQEALHNGTSRALLKRWGLAKDDDDADDDDDDGDNSDDSDFDASHPRWAAGSPGGIGGEFAPKDSGDATNALHDALSDNSQNSAPLDPDSAWATLISAIDKPSALGEGVEVAGMRDAFEMEMMQREAERQEQAKADAVAYAEANAARSHAAIATGAEAGAAAFPKPSGIPDDWIEKPADTPGGVIYSDPDNSNNLVRIMPANPNSPYSWQQVPYVIDQNGSFLDVSGNPIPGIKPGQTPEAHIPYSQFKYKR